jgi:anti-sigma factor (TIGR02949 family)
MKDDRLVAGLWCHDVLAKLSDYLDGDLPAPDRAQVEEHLRGCDACARFGGAFAATIRTLREHLLADEAGPEHLRERLRAALDAGEGQDG